MITLRNISCHIGPAALLQDVNLELQPGCIALVGPNGAGKSTLLKLLADGGRHFLRTSIRGELQLDKKALQKIPVDALARRRAFLPQQHVDALQLPVAEILELAAWPHGKASLPAALYQEALMLWQLEALAARAYSGLSGGERQRVQLARTWLQIRQHENPGERIWLLDEPQNALDLPHQQILQTQLRREAANGALVVFSTHDINFALHSAERIIVLREGRVHADGGSSAIADPALLQDVFGVRFSRLINPNDNSIWLTTS
jgi:iron complex transport system ATP-binding protein